jgi:hypothetical protein
MSFILWLLIAVVYITLFVTIALATLRKGHYLLFWVGIIFPCTVDFRCVDGTDCPHRGSQCCLTPGRLVEMAGRGLRGRLRAIGHCPPFARNPVQSVVVLKTRHPQRNRWR